jgi:hypothetical protein
MSSDSVIERKTRRLDRQKTFANGGSGPSGTAGVYGQLWDDLPKGRIGCHGAFSGTPFAVPWLTPHFRFNTWLGARIQRFNAS